MAKHGWKGFGIHPHIAENQPHEVRTLGMNHPVCNERHLLSKRKVKREMTLAKGHDEGT